MVRVAKHLDSLQNLADVKIFDINMHFSRIFKEEKVYSGSTESFGKQWAVGDVVGVFLDLIDKTISKYHVTPPSLRHEAFAGF